MKVDWIEVKQYKKKKRFVVLVDKKPVCIVKKLQDLSRVIIYLEGCSDWQLKDKKLKKILDKIKENSEDSIDIPV